MDSDPVKCSPRRTYFLSFDVGVKNMAVCYASVPITDTDVSQCEVRVHHWQILNCDPQSQEGITQPTCSISGCSCVVAMKCKYKKSIWYACKKHAKQFSTYDSGVQIHPSSGKQCCHHSEQDTPAPGASIFWGGAYHCKDCWKQISKRKSTWTKYKAEKPSLFKQRLYLIEQLRIMVDKHVNQLDRVFIEHQPVKKNPVMKGIADSMFTWFLCWGVQQSNCPGISVEYVSATLKLKHTDGKKQTYKDRKKSAIAYMNGACPSVWRPLWVSSKKKDDLADCLMQILGKLQEERNLSSFILT